MLALVERKVARRRVRKLTIPAGVQRIDSDRDVGDESLTQIKHIVVLMMENHSYDNYLGMLQGRGLGFTLDTEDRPTEFNLSNTGDNVPASHLSSTKQLSGVPTQSWAASHIQFSGGACDGFVKSIEDTLPGRDSSVAMGYWTETDLPFYYGLAKTFPLATRWHSSCLGPTFPNRRFLISGTSNGLIDDLPFNMVDSPGTGTIFDYLSAYGVSWINYHSVPRRQIYLKRILRARGVNALRAVGIALSGLFPSLKKILESKIQVTADLYPLGTLRSINHLRSIQQFYIDAKNGSLPCFSIVDPNFGSTSEENPQDIQDGENFAATIINAVMNGAGWKNTLLMWLYDEHGGYFDHVEPPSAVTPDDVPGESPMKRHWWLGVLLRFSRYNEEIESADAGPSTFEHLGFRVPAVAVSPFSRPNFVSETVFDHTAILKLIERKWNLPSLTRRDARANDVLELLDLDGPPAFLAPPVLAPSAKSSGG